MATTGSISSLVAAVRVWGESFLALVTLEGRQAGLSLAWMFAYALAAAIFAITGWVALLACAVLALVQNDIVGWGAALLVAALLSFAGAGGLVLLLTRRSALLLFPATQRQLQRVHGEADSS